MEENLASLATSLEYLSERLVYDKEGDAVGFAADSMPGDIARTDIELRNATHILQDYDRDVDLVEYAEKLS